MGTFTGPTGQASRPSRKTMRLTFHVTDGKVRLESHEWLEMICPPSVGERPEAKKHTGFWMELRGDKDRLLFFRTLNNPLGDSVEIHSPDGTMRREFADVAENVFEVLLPDDPGAEHIVFMGISLDPGKARRKRKGGSRELARFDVPQSKKGGGS